MQMEYKNLSIQVFEGPKDAPLVLLNGDHNEGEAIWNILIKENISCTFVCIGGIDWEHDLAPWDAPAAFKKGDPFTGGADDHLNTITEHIIPELEEKLGYTFTKKYIAGYSLAGLFAMYSTYQTDVFDGFVSASGSMWFPDFLAYTEEHEISKQVKKAYFSIGDKEGKTKNPVMQPVEENTRKLEHALSEQGIETTFELNAGGHFVDDDIRLAKGIIWICKMA